MRIFINNPNVDNTDPDNYPGGRVKDDQGSNNGTPVDQRVYDDFHQMRMKLARRYGIIENDLPDNETNGYQFIDGLKALPSKNDYVLNIGGNSALLTIATKINLFESGEQIVCKAGFDIGAQTFPFSTLIRGNNNVNITASVKDRFLANEYVRVIKNGSAVDIIRLVDSNNFDNVADSIGYLKAATEAQEAAGTDLAATTPDSNLYIYERRTTGDLSDTYLATQSSNGLMSQEDKTKLDNIGSEVLNRGFISGVDPGAGTDGSNYTVGGDVASAVLTTHSGGVNVIRVTVANTNTNLSYFVRIFIEVTGADIGNESGIKGPVFKVITATSFDIAIAEIGSVTQSLRVHIETVKY